MMEGYLAAFSVNGLLWAAIGASLGIFVGAIPGLSGAMVIALALPLTYFMSASDALILLITIYVGATTGGLISATLMNMPGTEAAIMTTLDGYPMAQKGEPSRALGLGVGASLVGGMLAWVVLAVFSPPLSDFAVRFGPYEIFSMTLVALVLIAAISKGGFINGLISAGLGALLSFPGIDPVSGSLRLTFGVSALDNGFSLLPVMLGMLVLSQVLIDVSKTATVAEIVDSVSNKVAFKLRDFRLNGWNLIRSSIIGTWIGILPGIGATTASIVSYGVAKATSKNADQFGKGASEGIVASETANNAAAVGSLAPLIALGIPGSVTTAILLGAMVIHDLNPGPLLFSSNPDIAYTIIAGALLANIIVFLIMWIATPLLAKLMYLDKSVLFPVIVVFCVIGAFSVSSDFFDVLVMLGFGVFGYILQKARVPVGPFIIAYILTPMAEVNLRSGLVLYDGSYLPLLTRPISLFFVAASVATLLWVAIGAVRESRKG